MVVYAIYLPDRHAYLGTHYYVSDKPKLFWTKGAAENKLRRYSRYFSEKGEIVEFELVRKTL